MIQQLRELRAELSNLEQTEATGGGMNPAVGNRMDRLRDMIREQNDLIRIQDDVLRTLEASITRNEQTLADTLSCLGMIPRFRQ